jgi:hypothetical protein
MGGLEYRCILLSDEEAAWGYGHLLVQRAPFILMGVGCPIFRQVRITLVLVENDIPIQLQIMRTEPYNLSNTTPLVTNITTIRLNTSRNTKVCNTQMINHTKLESHK